MKKNILIGIDVGGTHTDGVAVDIDSGRLVRKLKVRTGPDLIICIEEALGELLSSVDPASVRRISLSTTLVTNAVVSKRLEPVGMALMAGPGLDPSSFATDPNCRIIAGAMDHRGREIFPVDPAHVSGLMESFLMKGISVVAVAGKFSVRNPSHELAVAAIAEKTFEHVVCSHELSGALNFPRRAATAYLSAAVWRKHANFITSAKKSAERLSCVAPLHLLRADGGAQTADSFKNASEAALSGPAASIMGISAVADVNEESVGLDVGGTTTDISFFVKGAPLLEQSGATVGDYLTQIRALFNRSIAAGGDSALKIVDGSLHIGPERKGEAAGLGGPCPTPTDAMIILGRAPGDRSLALSSIEPLALELGRSTEEFCEMALLGLCRIIFDEVTETLAHVNSRPVYTIHELLEDHTVLPRRIVMVGGPAEALAPYMEKISGLKVVVPDCFDVTNAVGAAVATLNLEVNATADTGAGRLTIPEAGVHREISREYSFEEMLAEATRELENLADTMSSDQTGAPVDVAESESFNIIEGYGFTGAMHRVRLQMRPSILCAVKEAG